MKKNKKMIIRPGMDYLTTLVAKQRVIIPAERLGGAKEDFNEMITFVGASLNPSVGNADTIMERLESVDFGKPVKTRLVAFANVSAAPIRLQIENDEPIYFDLYVTLSPTVESPGETIYRSQDKRSGSFESELSLSPLFELRPLGKGNSIFIDTGKTPLPGFPMRLGTAGGKWTCSAPTKNAVRSYGGESLFYSTEVYITALANDKSLLAACAKRQAEFVTSIDRPSFERINFPNPKEYTNIELERWMHD